MNYNGYYNNTFNEWIFPLIYLVYFARNSSYKERPPSPQAKGQKQDKGRY